MVLGFGNGKGGASKTSTANAFMNYLKYSGKCDLKMRAIDLDAQGSWTKKRDRDYRNLHQDLEEEYITKDEYEKILEEMYFLYKEPIEDFYKNAEKLTKGYDLVVLDMPGNFSEVGVREAYMFLDKMVVPTGLSYDDIDGTEDFLNKYFELSYNPRKEGGYEPTEIIGLLNKIGPSFVKSEEKKMLLSNELVDMFGFPFIKEYITWSEGVFGKYPTTYQEIRNSNGKKVFEPVFESLAKRLKLIK